MGNQKAILARVCRPPPPHFFGLSSFSFLLLCTNIFCFTFCSSPVYYSYSWEFLLIFFFSFTGSTKLDTTSPLPGTMMHIYAGDAVNHVPAENVKIGDPLTLKVALDQQEVYGMTVADCTVRDGLGWSEQLLYNDQGYVALAF